MKSDAISINEIPNLPEFKWLPVMKFYKEIKNKPKFSTVKFLKTNLLQVLYCDRE